MSKCVNSIDKIKKKVSGFTVLCVYRFGKLELICSVAASRGF